MIAVAVPSSSAHRSPLLRHRVLVTGGTSGIGLELARAFLQRGSRVAICGRSRERLAVARNALRSFGHGENSVECLACDLASPEQVADLVPRAVEALDGLSILVNNAAIQLQYRLLEQDSGQTTREAAREIQVNLTSAISLTAAALPHLELELAAAVVNISSGLALEPKASAPVYCATKAALHSFSRSLRYQLQDAGSHVRVLEALPPLVNTPMSEGRDGHKLQPADVASAVLRALEQGQDEIRLGGVRVLALLQRLWPRKAARLVRES